MYNVTCSVHTLLTVCFLTFKQAQCTCVTVHSKAINKLYGSVILYIHCTVHSTLCIFLTLRLPSNITENHRYEVS
jgi:hypothetical protein